MWAIISPAAVLMPWLGDEKRRPGMWEAGVNPAQCRCCIGGAVLIGHWGYALGRREPRWMPESEYLPVYDAQEASPVQGGCSCL